MKKLNIFLMLLITASALAFSSCKEDEKEEDNSLYARLGGKDAITAVVDEFLANVVADDRINGFFSETTESGLNNLRTQLIDQICDAAGGPCTYNGLSMVEAHTGMNITDEDFNAMVEDLVAALDTFEVPETEKGELLTVLGGLKSEIVGL